MNILITEKEFQEYRKLQQEKEELIKWLKTEYMCFDNESDECIIARQILSKLKEN
jgi:hypothetical protein